MSRRFKNISVMFVLALLVSVCASITAFAASEKTIKTEQGGYVTITNIVKEIKFTPDGPGTGDTIFVANAPVTITIHGDASERSISYIPNAKLSEGLLDMGEIREDIEIKNNVAVLSKPGYYTGVARWSVDGILSPENEAGFVIQIVGGTVESKTESKSVAKAETISAIPTASKVLVDGKEISFEAYNINGNNYFKLRDLAMAVNGTEKSFEVSWDSFLKVINLTSNQPYTSDGKELLVSQKPTSKNAKLTNDKIYLDGKEVQLTAYNIDGNNYFKLRDIAKVIGFGVTWDGKTNTIGIDTKSAFKE